MGKGFQEDFLWGASTAAYQKDPELSGVSRRFLKARGEMPYFFLKILLK